jgi:hypothetical protein
MSKIRNSSSMDAVFTQKNPAQILTHTIRLILIDSQFLSHKFHMFPLPSRTATRMLCTFSLTHATCFEYVILPNFVSLHVQAL